MRYRSLVAGLCLAGMGSIYCGNGMGTEKSRTPGTYSVFVGGRPARLEIQNNGFCSLVLPLSDSLVTDKLIIHDFSCDGQTDSSAYISKAGGIDSLSKEQLTPLQKGKLDGFLQDAYAKAMTGTASFTKASAGLDKVLETID